MDGPTRKLRPLDRAGVPNQSLATTTPKDTPRRGRVNDDPATEGVKAWMLEHRGQPGDALARLLERRLRDWLVGLPPVPARWVS